MGSQEELGEELGNDETGRSVWSLMADRRFGPYFWGNVIANAGFWGTGVAAVVVTYQMTRSAQLVGLVTVLQFAGPLLLAPVGGTLADRFDRRTLLMLTQTLSALFLLSLSVVLAAGVGGEDNPVPIFVTCTLLGISLAVADPARHALVPTLVPRVDIPTAVSLNTVTFNVGRAVGPAVIGLLLTVSSPAATFAAAAAGPLVLVACMAFVPRGQARSGPRGAALGGVTYLRQHPRLIALLAGVTATGFASDPVITLVPLLVPDLLASVDRGLGITEEALAVGLMASAFGVGAVSMVVPLQLIHRRLGLRSSGIAGLAILAATMLALSLAPSVVAGMAIVLVAGAGYLLALTAFTSALQVAIPDELRGRIMAIWGMCFLGSRPLAAQVDATVAHLGSARLALGVAVVVAAGAAVLIAVVLRPDRGTPRAA